MKKYHLGDLLSATEIALTLLIIVLTCVGTSADIVIWIFVAAELCDAFDGPCARRWPYPKDGKKRWWRTHVQAIEHISDIALLVVTAVYLSTVYMRTDGWNTALSFVIIPAIFCGLICILCEYGIKTGLAKITSLGHELWRITALKIVDSEEYHPTVSAANLKGSQENLQALVTKAIIVRRWFYISIIAYTICLFVLATSWPLITQQIALGAGSVIGIGLVIYKKDRAFHP